MDFEIIDEVHSNIVGMDDEYEILHQEIQIQSILSQSSSQSSLIFSLYSIISSYQLIFILLVILMILIISIYVVNFIIQSNNYKQLKETLSSSSSSSVNDELIKLEKEVDSESLSNTFIVRLQIIAQHIINHDSKREIIKYSDYLSRIDKILHTLVLPRIRLSIPSFLSYIKVVAVSNTLIELDNYVVRFNILPLLENKSFKTDLDNARDNYEKLKYTNSSENLKLSSIDGLKSACTCDNADLIREALAFAKAYNLDKDYKDDYNNAEIALHNLETIEKKLLIKEKQRRLNEHISVLNFGATKIKNELIESGNNLISGMIKNNDIMLIESESVISPSDTTAKIVNDDDDDDGDGDDDIIILNHTLSKSAHCSEQLVLFSNDNCNAMLPISNRKNSLALVDQTGNVVNNPEIKQQFALTIHKTETDIINLNKETGLEIAKAVKEYNQTIDDNDRHMEEEWKKCREAARIRVEKKISDAIADDNKFSLALQQNKRLSEKLDMCTSSSDENTYICHQNWKIVQQKWDAIFFMITVAISFCVFIKTSSNQSVFTWLNSLFNSLCHEITFEDQTNVYKTTSPASNTKALAFCEGNTCSYDESTVWIWWNLDPFRPLSYVLGIAIYNTILFLAYFKLNLTSLNTLRCCLNIITRIMTPLLLSFMTYKYANLVQLSKYILVIGSGLCLCAPITRFFWPFRNFSYLLLGHTIFHFVLLGMDWHLTWAVSLSNKVIDMRWICIYIIYPLFISVISAYLGCMHYSFKDQIDLHDDFFSLTECVSVKLF